MNSDSKVYRRIFFHNKLSWEEKLKRAEEYAISQINHRIHADQMRRFVLSTGMLPLNLN